MAAPSGLAWLSATADASGVGDDVLAHGALLGGPEPAVDALRVEGVQARQRLNHVTLRHRLEADRALLPRAAPDPTTTAATHVAGQRRLLLILARLVPIGAPFARVNSAATLAKYFKAGHAATAKRSEHIS